TLLTSDNEWRMGDIADAPSLRDEDGDVVKVEVSENRLRISGYKRVVNVTNDGTKKEFSVTDSKGVVHDRTSVRDLTHAIVVQRDEPFVCWASSLDLAKVRAAQFKDAVDIEIVPVDGAPILAFREA